MEQRLKFFIKLMSKNSISVIWEVPVWFCIFRDLSIVVRSIISFSSLDTILPATLPAIFTSLCGHHGGW
jgi:hypothetical protein